LKEEPKNFPLDRGDDPAKKGGSHNEREKKIHRAEADKV
jgi:hypothetical protein